MSPANQTGSDFGFVLERLPVAEVELPHQRLELVRRERRRRFRTVAVVVPPGERKPRDHLRADALVELARPLDGAHALVGGIARHAQAELGERPREHGLLLHVRFVLRVVHGAPPWVWVTWRPDRI